MTMEKLPARSRTEEIVIGKTRFIVTTHFSENARENAEQKLLRYVSNRIEEDLKVGRMAC